MFLQGERVTYALRISMVKICQQDANVQCFLQRSKVVRVHLMNARMIISQRSFNVNAYSTNLISTYNVK